MRRIVIASLATASSVGLLFAYPTSHNASASSGSTSAGSAAAGATAGAAASGATAAAGATTASGSTASGSAKTYDGAAVDTRWGVVQVQITVQNGKLVAAKALQYPNDNGHSQGINDYALPILNAEAVKAGSASIDAVGGATVTTNGYTTSLQSALDAAHL